MHHFDAHYHLNPENYCQRGGRIWKENIYNGNEMWKTWGETWTRNLEANKTAIRRMPMLSSLYGSWSGHTALVVANGASTHRDMKKIAQAQSQGIHIVSVDRMHERLCDNGIFPDMTMTGDSSETVADFFTRPPRDRDKFAVRSRTHPKVIELLKHTNCYAYEAADPWSPWARVVRDAFGVKIFACQDGAVTTFNCTGFCYWMGCDIIGNIGNELSWKRGDPIDDVYKGLDFIMLDEELGVATIQPFFVAAIANALFPVMYPEVEWIDCGLGITSGWVKEPIEYLMQIHGEKREP